MSRANRLNHLAIIMDGNGRWAKKQGKLRVRGHEAGAKKVREITEFVVKTEINYLTLYAFSTENWNRPETEVKALMKLLEKYLVSQRDVFIKNSIKFDYIGDISLFSEALKTEIEKSVELTKHCTALTQVLALNYGFKDELVRAVKKLKNSEINEKSINDALDIGVDVDLLIRTGGESRLSNFLLWQGAYAELGFTDTLWPDFTCKELEDMILKYKKTHRRFGKL